MQTKEVSREKLDAIEGWLSPHALVFTEYVFAFQREKGWISGVLELGVFKGKYLSLLAQQVADAGVPVVGVDAFLEKYGVQLAEEWKQHAENAIIGAVESVAGSAANVRLIAGYTHDVPAEKLRTLCPQGYGFISVDAGHDAADVEHDAAMAEALLHDHGVVAFDDIYNAACPGVAEGFMRYMSAADPNLAPFATCGNKVFACRPETHAQYYEFSRSLARNVNEVAPELARTLDQLNANESNGWSPRLFGFEIVPFL